MSDYYKNPSKDQKFSNEKKYFDLHFTILKIGSLKGKILPLAIRLSSDLIQLTMSLWRMKLSPRKYF